MQDHLDPLLEYFLQDLEGLRDVVPTFDLGASLESDRRERAILANAAVPHDADGDPTMDEGAYWDAKLEEIHEMYDRLAHMQTQVDRLVRVGIHHGLEVFMKGVAIESARDLGQEPPDLEKFHPVDWFAAAGIDLRSLPRAEQLIRVRDEVGNWKHSRFSQRADAAWFMRETYTAAAFLGWDVEAERIEIPVLQGIVAEFGKALVREVRSKTGHADTSDALRRFASDLAKTRLLPDGL